MQRTYARSGVSSVVLRRACSTWASGISEAPWPARARAMWSRAVSSSFSCNTVAATAPSSRSTHA